jgi:phage host-nuclease inhibitor protein Gam
MKTKAITDIKTWDDVDELVKRLGEIEMDIEGKENRMTQEIEAIKAKYKPEINILHAKAKLIREELERFARQHRTDFSGKNTKILNFGKLRFKTPPARLVFLKKKEEIFDELQKLGFSDCIKIKKEVIISKVKTLDDGLLQKIGCKKVRDAEKFYIDVFRDKIIPTDEIAKVFGD